VVERFHDAFIRKQLTAGAYSNLLHSIAANASVPADAQKLIKRDIEDIATTNTESTQESH
jgi:hypothetical protein